MVFFWLSDCHFSIRDLCDNNISIFLIKFQNLFHHSQTNWQIFGIDFKNKQNSMKIDWIPWKWFALQFSCLSREQQLTRQTKCQNKKCHAHNLRAIHNSTDKSAYSRCTYRIECCVQSAYGIIILIEFIEVYEFSFG